MADMGGKKYLQKFDGDARRKETTRNPWTFIKLKYV
jgi:hypothetical protein